MTTWNRVTVLLIFVGVLRSVYNDSPCERHRTQVGAR